MAVPSSTNSTDAPTNTTIVIIGGSFAGLTCARHIHKHYNDQNYTDKLEVIIIEPNHYFEYTPGILRCFVTPDHYNSITTEFDHIPVTQHKYTTVIHDCCTSINHEQQTVTLQNTSHNPIHYDYCILACGSDYDPNS